MKGPKTVALFSFLSKSFSVKKRRSPSIAPMFSQAAFEGQAVGLPNVGGFLIS